MNVFQVTLHEPRSLIEWFGQRDRIDLNPGFQRRSFLWSTDKQVKLIDTVINGFDVPKLYLADFRSTASSLRETAHDYAVIDGKQRLETFFRFFTDQLRLTSDCKFLDVPDVDLKDLTYSELRRKHFQIARRIERFDLTVMSVVSSDKARVRDMFVRLNFGVAVNAAERRNAMLGIVPEIIRELAAHPLLLDRIRFSTLRMAEFNVAAKVLLIEYRNGFVDTKAKNLDNLVLEGESRDIQTFLAARDRCIEVFDQMAEVFVERDQLLSAAGSLPLYYWLCKHEQEDYFLIRPFLTEFNDAVRKNLELSRVDPEASNAELSNYYTMGRTTNDQGSLEGRYRILSRRFREFVSTRRRRMVRATMS